MPSMQLAVRQRSDVLSDSLRRNRRPTGLICLEERPDCRCVPCGSAMAGGHVVVVQPAGDSPQRSIRRSALPDPLDPVAANGA